MSRAKLHDVKQGRSRSNNRLTAGCEALENRQMLSLTIDVRAEDGSKIVAATSVGQVINLQVWATITGKNADPTQDNLQDVFGSFLSSERGLSSIDGNLAPINLPAFSAQGSAAGYVQDLNGDGNLDVGSNSINTPRFEFFAARSEYPSTSSYPNAVIVGGSLEFEIAELTYTVTNLNQGGETDINFRPEPTAGELGAVWSEDNNHLNGEDGFFVGGAPLLLTDAAIAPSPIAKSITVYAQANNAASINELAFDTSVDSFDPSSVVVSSPTTHGTAILQSDGSFIYTPTAGFTGTDSFTYTATDIDGFTTNPATVTIDVGTPAPPVAGNVSKSLNLNSNLEINVLASDTAAKGLSLNAKSVSVIGAPLRGTAVVEANGEILYTPNHGYIGTDAFTYRVSDSLGHASNLGAVSLTVVQTTPPTAGNVYVTIPANQSDSIKVVSSDTAAAGLTIDPTSVQIVYAPTHGRATVESNGTVLYTPVAGYLGTDLIQYSVRDSNGVASNNSGSINIDLVTGPPVAATVNATAPYETPVNINVLSSAVAAPATTLNTNVILTSAPTHGSATVLSDGSVHYTPANGFSGQDAFAYTVQDSDGQRSSAATIIVTVQPGPPVAGNDSVTLISNQTTSIKVLGNDSAAAGATLVPASVTVVSAPSHGTAVPQTDGSILYTPISGFTGSDSFTYTVADNLGLVSNVASVNLTVDSKLTGTVIGTAGSYRDHGTTIANVFDGNLSTYFDAPTANGNWAGLDLGSTFSITQISYAPRAGFPGRMIGGVFQGSNDPTFSAGVIPLGTISTTPATGVLTTLNVSVPSTFRYVRYLSPAGSYGNMAEIGFTGAPATLTLTHLTGTVFGTAGSYGNRGNSIANAFDGNLSTYFDGPAGSGNIVGLDLGTPQTISQISFAPRAGWAQRMVGGTFQASNSANFSTGVVTLYQITSPPVSNVLTTVSINVTGNYRYVRYVGPANSYGDVAEILFYE